MQTATSETESKSLDLSIRMHHYFLRAPCPKGQGIATELRTNLLRVKKTQSLINRDGVHPGLHSILDVRADACLPSSHPLCAGKQRVGRTTTKSH